MIRNVIVFVMAIVMISSFAVAADFSYGLKAGLNMASVSVDPSTPGVDYKSRMGFGFGGIVKYGLGEKMAIRTDVLYLMKGAKEERTGGDTEWKVDNLVIAPFFTYDLAKWDCKVSPGNDAAFFAQIGPEIGFNMTAEDKDGNELKDWESTEFALNIGAGLKIPMGGGALVPDLRYSMGLTNLTSTSGVTFKSSGIQIMFGYMF